MITKIAVTAWKRLFPYLSEESQHAIAKKIRKPLAEYNKGVALGNKNKAKRLGVEIIGDDGKSRFANMMTKSYGGARASGSGKLLVDRMDTLMNLPGVRFLSKPFLRKRYGANNTVFDDTLKEIKELKDKFSSRKDSVPVAIVRESKGTAKDDFFRNTLLSHELSENKNFFKYYKLSPDGKTKIPIKGVELARPAYEAPTLLGKLLHPKGISRGHASLGVLSDELKGALKSGYTDLHTRVDLDASGYVPKKGFYGVLGGRLFSGELGQMIRAGKDPLYLAPQRYANGLRNGQIKHDQKKFFRKLDKVQKAHNVPNPNNTPSKLDAASPTYILPELR